MAHPLRAARAPSRGHRQRTGGAGSAAIACLDLTPASQVLAATTKDK